MKKPARTAKRTTNPKPLRPRRFRHHPWPCWCRVDPMTGKPLPGEPCWRPPPADAVREDSQ